MNPERNGHSNEPGNRGNGHRRLAETGSHGGEESYEIDGDETDDLIDPSSDENHQPVSSHAYRLALSEANEEAAEADESSFESVDGWYEPAARESTYGTGGEEALIDAYFAQGGDQEFLPVIGALAPVLKSVLPALIARAAPGIISRLTPRARERFQSLRSLSRRPGMEAVDEGSFDERAIVAALEQAEVVIGTDDRAQIQDTKQVPWRRICHLRIEAANGRTFLGTGFLVAPRTVVTAGHCVFMKAQGGWARRITVSPGRNGTTSPFGQVDAVEFRSVRGWVNANKRDYDYGAIVLPRNMPIPANVGAFGFANFPTPQLLQRKLNTAGYPGDKPPGSMWFMGRRTTQVTARTLVYEIDTAGGQSGSPVWVNVQGKRTVVGIHTNGASAGNSATRITKPVYDNIKRWSGEGGRQAALSSVKPVGQRQQQQHLSPDEQPGA